MKKRILIDLKQEYYFNSFISILHALADDDRFEVSFLVGKNEERRWGVFPTYQKRRIQEWLRSRGYAVADSPQGFDAVVGADALRDPDRYGHPLLFVSDHGPGTKTLRIRNIVRQTDRRYTVFVEGQYWMDTIRRFGFTDAANWVMTGVPKLDTLFWKGYYDRERILRGLGLDPDKKTVLFAPSYRPSCIPFVKTRVASLAPKHNVIIKLHPYSWGGKYAPLSQCAIYRKMARRTRGVALIPKDDYDIHPYAFAANTVVSDTSSALAICLALGRVGVIADFPYPRMKHSDGMPVVSEEPGEYLRGVFVRFNSTADLAGAVETALFPGKPRIRALREYRNYYFTGLDGKAGTRATKAIADALFT